MIRFVWYGEFSGAGKEFRVVILDEQVVVQARWLSQPVWVNDTSRWAVMALKRCVKEKFNEPMVL